MDHMHFDMVARPLTGSPFRRDVLRGVLGAGLGLGSLRLADVTEAKKQRKSKKKKAKKKKQTLQPAFNIFGCLDVGQPCRGDNSLCCSGICAGRKPKPGKPDTRVCAAHNTGLCTAELDACTAGANTACGANSVCARTTGNAGFCADLTGLGDPTQPSEVCRICSRDTDCEAEFGAGAACLVIGGVCADFCRATGGTACYPAGA